MVDVEATRHAGAELVLQRSPVALDLVSASMGTNGFRLTLFTHVAPSLVHADDGRVDWAVGCVDHRLTLEVTDPAECESGTKSRR